MPKSDEKTMSEIVFPKAPSYGKGTPSLTGHGSNLTKKEKAIGAKHREKSATIESARRLALQAKDGMDDVTYSVMDSNQSMIESADDIATRTKGVIAQKNVVRYNAHALGRHQMNLDILQDAAERTMVEEATTDLEPDLEPEPVTQQGPTRDTRGLVARILNLPQQ